MRNGKFLLQTYFFTPILIHMCQFEVEIIRSYMVFLAAIVLSKLLAHHRKDMKAFIIFKLIYFIKWHILCMEVCSAQHKHAYT